MNYMIFKDGRSMTGLLPWDKTNFERIIKQKTSVITSLPEKFSGVFTVSDTIKIYPTTLNPLSYDTLYQQLSGPFYSFSDKEAVGTYVVVERPIDAIKNQLKSRVASERYTWEVSGIEATIQDKKVTITTDRETRNIFFHAQQLVTNNTTWKFHNNLWLILTPGDIIFIVSLIFSHIQECFEWEKEVVDAINKCTSKTDLKGVDLQSPFEKNKRNLRYGLTRQQQPVEKEG